MRTNYVSLKSAMQKELERLFLSYCETNYYDCLVEMNNYLLVKKEELFELLSAPKEQDFYYLENVVMIDSAFRRLDYEEVCKQIIELSYGHILFTKGAYTNVLYCIQNHFERNTDVEKNKKFLL